MLSRAVLAIALVAAAVVAQEEEHHFPEYPSYDGAFNNPSHRKCSDRAVLGCVGKCHQLLVGPPLFWSFSLTLVYSISYVDVLRDPL